MVNKSPVPLIEEHFLQVQWKEPLIVSPSWGGGGIDGGTVRDNGAIHFGRCVGYMRAIDIRGSTSDSSDIPPELDRDVGKFEIFIKKGRAEDVVKVRLGCRAVGSSVI